MNKFELEVLNVLKVNGFKIIEENPKYIDILAEKDGKKISIEIKDVKSLFQYLPKAFGQLMAAKCIYETNEEWLVIRNKSLCESEYLKVFKENNIKIFTIDNEKVVELTAFSTIKKNREVRRGIDYKKLAKIWKVLEERGTWMHIADISRSSGINECTVRWYIDRYFKDAIDEEKIVPTIRLRMIKLKSNMDFNSYVKALNFINRVKGNK